MLNNVRTNEVLTLKSRLNKFPKKEFIRLDMENFRKLLLMLRSR